MHNDGLTVLVENSLFADNGCAARITGRRREPRLARLGMPGCERRSAAARARRQRGPHSDDGAGRGQCSDRRGVVCNLPRERPARDRASVRGGLRHRRLRVGRARRVATCAHGACGHRDERNRSGRRSRVLHGVGRRRRRRTRRGDVRCHRRVPRSPSARPLSRCTASDAAGNVASASFDVHVKGAAEQLANLLTAVTGIGPGTEPRRQGESRADRPGKERRTRDLLHPECVQQPGECAVQERRSQQARRLRCSPMPPEFGRCSAASRDQHCRAEAPSGRASAHPTRRSLFGGGTAADVVSVLGQRTATAIVFAQVFPQDW